MEVLTHSKEETEEVAGTLITSLKKAPEATILALQGDLGSGKTAFTKGIGKAFGVTEEITSPTFVIEKIYQLEGQKFKYLIHIDAYRLDSADELLSLGFKEISSDPQNCIVIEWPEKVSTLLPDTTKYVHFMFVDENIRKIESPLVLNKV
jgi:tRNA threonylcarbamoyladenosine biosynthesis protein TsaE